MAGSVTGGKHAATTNKKRYGTGFYPMIGELGGSKVTDKTKNKGFASMTAEARREAGRLGGLKSRRGPAIKITKISYEPQLAEVPVKKIGFIRAFLNGFNRGRR